MAKLYNLARMTTATTGTGTITLGAAVSGFLSFAGAGVSNGDVVSYGISDGANGEVGTGTYTASGTTLTRTPTTSTNGNAAISLSGVAQVFITVRKEDILSAAVQADQETASSNATAVTPGVQQFHPSAAKAWVKFNGSGTVLASYNISSVTRSSAGQYVVNFTTAFSSANYCAVLSVDATGGTSLFGTVGTQTASTCPVTTFASSFSVADCTNAYLACFGDD